MKQDLQEFLRVFDYPKDAAGVLLDCWDRIAQHGDAEKFTALMSSCAQGDFGDEAALISQCDTIASHVGISPYTVYLLFFIALAKPLKLRYAQKGLSEAIYFDTMCDLKYKLLECQLVKGIVGIFVPFWFFGFFKLERFALGRLQFEVIPFCYDRYESDGAVLVKNDPVINVHIPRTATPLSYESVQASYAQAAAFFENKLGNTPLFFVCYSWLLDPINDRLLSQTSNIRRFIQDFQIIHVDKNTQNNYFDLWRLFDMDYPGTIDAYPGDTSFRRAYKEFLKQGGVTGSGYGIYLYDRSR